MASNAGVPGYGQTFTTSSGGSEANALEADFRKMSLEDQRVSLFGPEFRHDPRASSNGYAMTTLSGPFVGQKPSPVILDVLIRTISEAEEFMYRHVFPLEAVPPGGSVHFSQIRFNETTLDKIPEMGVARTMTQTFRSWSTSLERQGLAFMMEDAYAMTERGIEGYLASIHGLRTATIITIIKECYYALLTSQDPGTIDYLTRMNIIHPAPCRQDIFEAEKRQWSILLKTEFGYRHMVQQGKQVLTDRGVIGDTLILPNGTLHLVQWKPEMRDISKVGEAGMSAFLHDRKFAMDVNGYRVEETHLFRDDDNLLEDPFTRNRMIGEYFRSRHRDNCANMPTEYYRSMMRDVTIYDQQRNRFVRIGLSDLTKFDGVFERDAAGNPTGPPTEEIGQLLFQGHDSVGAFLHQNSRLKPVVDNLATRLALARSSIAGERARADKRLVPSYDAWFEAVTGGDEESKLPDAYRVQRGPATGAGRSRRSTRQRTQAELEEAMLNGGGDDMNTDQEDVQDEDPSSYPHPQTFPVWNLTPAEVSAASYGDILFEHMAQPSRNRYTYQAFKNRIEAREWTVPSIYMLASGINQALLNIGDIDLLRKEPFMRCLLVQFGNSAAQEKVWDLSSDREFRATFKDVLEKIMPRPADSQPRTEGVMKHWAAKSPATLPPSVTGKPRIDRRSWEQYIQTLRIMDKKVHEIIPDFLPGAAAMLATRPDLDLVSIKAHIGKLRELAQMVVDYKMNDAGALRSSVLADEGKSSYGVRGELRDQHPIAKLRRMLLLLRLPGSVVALCNAAKENIVVPLRAVVDRDLKDDKIPAAQQAIIDLMTAVDADFDHKSAMDKDKADDRMVKQGFEGAPGNKYSAKRIAEALYRAPISGLTFFFFAENDIPYPLDFLLFRPHMVSEMSCAAFLKSGRQTGRAYFGEANFQLSNDGRIKVLYGFFHCYCGARVVNPQNIYIMPNVRCKRDLYGGGTKIFDPLNLKTVEDYRAGNTGDHSLFVCAILPTDDAHEQVMDITGKFSSAVDVSRRNGSTTIDRLHYSSAEIYSEVWMWKHRQNYVDIDYTFNVEQQAYNTVVFSGHSFHARWAGAVGIVDRGYRSPGQGHWGDNVYEGVVADRCGGGRGYIQTVAWPADCHTLN